MNLKCIISSATLIVGIACTPEAFDTTPKSHPEQSVGEDLYFEFCTKLAYSEDPSDPSAVKYQDSCLYGLPLPQDAGPQMRTLHRERDNLIAALNASIPKDVGSDLAELLRNTAELIDNNLIPNQTRGIADLIDRILESDDALQTLAKMDHHQSYQPDFLEMALADAVLSYENIYDALYTLLPLLDGPQQKSWQTFLQVMQAQLQNDFDFSDTTREQLKDFLLTEHPEFYDQQGLYIAARDKRGIAQLSSLSDPYVDKNNDSLADINSYDEFVDAYGATIVSSSPFYGARKDNFNRSLDSQQQPLYKTIDTTRTLLSGLLYSTQVLAKNDPLFMLNSALPLQALLGNKKTKVCSFDNGTEIAVPVYDVAQSALYPMVQTLSPWLDQSFMQPALQLQEQLFNYFESDMAESVQLALNVRQWLKDYEQQDLTPHNTLFVDLLNVLKKIAQNEQLLTDVTLALKNPQVKKLGSIFAEHMRYKDYIDFNHDDMNAPVTGKLSVPVDRKLGSIPSNRSAFYRLMHIIHDTNHAPVCNKQNAKVFGLLTYNACDLFEIDNMAVFYVKAIAGSAELKFKPETLQSFTNVILGLTQSVGNDFDPLEFVSGIKGLRYHPTPQALNRLLFAPPNKDMQQLMDPAVGIDGVPIINKHSETIFIWELYDFYGALRPLAQAFDKHDSAQLLIDLMDVLFEHWNKTGVVQFEELIARILSEGKLTEILGNVVYGVDRLQGQSTLNAMMRYALDTSHPNISTLTSPAYILVDQVQKLLDIIENNPKADAAFTTLTDNFIDHLLQINYRAKKYVFTDRKVKALLQTSCAASAKLLQNHQGLWAESLPQDFIDALEHPVLASSLQLLEEMQDNPEIQKHLDALLQHLLAPTKDNEHFVATALTFADGLQILNAAQSYEAFFKPLAQVFEPTQGNLVQSLNLLRAIKPYDTKKVLTRLAKNFVALRPEQKNALLVLTHTLIQVNRTSPGSTQPLNKGDVKAILVAVRNFLRDDVNGIERLYNVIKERKR